MAAKYVRVVSLVHPEDVIYISIPLYHGIGSIALGQVLCQGATAVVRRKFSASNFWTDCIKYKCTVSSKA